MIYFFTNRKTKQKKEESVEKKRLKKVGYRVDEQIYSQMKELAKKERWSLSRLTEVAMEYYLKLRGRR